MRFERLEIEKYGRCEKRSMDLETASGLAVIYGPNEAGKSTSLQAITDLLYGVEDRSTYQHSFGGPSIRLGAILRFADASCLRLVRTKGRSGTLRDATNTVLDEAVLGRHLGSIGRNEFQNLFGLNHEALRKGGDSLLKHDGDIGRIIVEAGGGLGSLLDEVASLGARADGIFASRRGKDRTFYSAIDDFAAANKTIQSSLVTADAYDRDVKAHRKAAIAKEDLQARRVDLNAAIRKVDRLIRVWPHMTQYKSLLKQLEAYDDTLQLGAEFVSEVAAAQSEITLAAVEVDTHASKIKQLKAECDALQLREDVLAAQDVIEGIYQQGVHVEKERKDRPERDNELAEAKSHLDDLYRLTGVSRGVDLASMAPSEVELLLVDRLADEEVKLNSAIDAAVKRRDSLTSGIEQIDARQAVRISARRHEPLGFSEADFTGIEAHERAGASSKKKAEKARTAVVKRLAALGYETMESLTEALLPALADLQSQIDQWDSLHESLEEQTGKCAERKGLIDGLQARLTQYRIAGDAPTDQAIQGARDARSAAWKSMRDIYLNDDPAAIISRPLSERVEEVRLVEQLISDADSLVDRKSTEAERVALLVNAERELAEAEAAQQAGIDEVSRLESAVVEADARWAQAWPAAVAYHTDLTRQRHLVQERDALVNLDTTAVDLESDADKAAAEFDLSLDRLRAAEDRLRIASDSTNDSKGDNTTVNGRVTAIRSSIRSHEADYADFRSDTALHQTNADELAALKPALAALQERRAAWQTDWSAAIQLMRIPTDSLPDLAKRVRNLWAQSPSAIESIKNTQKRLNSMDRDEKRLIESIATLPAEISNGVAADPIAAAYTLKERLDAAIEIKTQKRAIDTKIAQLLPVHEAAVQRAAAAAGKVESLSAQTHCALTDLAQVAARVQTRQTLISERASALQSIDAAGDGHTLEQLQSDVADFTLDELELQHDKLSQGEDPLKAEEEEAIRQEHDLGKILADYGSEASITRAMAERESASTRLQEAISEYLDLTLARSLLSSSIARIRDEQQDPLLRRAGELFATGTCGAFRGIDSHVDAKGLPVVQAVRANGDKVEIDTLSAGTGDQLFLAFRVAAVERYCQSSEPIPFIADDLLVHFDEDRTRAALNVLAELGQTTQVILFTHHPFVRDACADLVSQGRAGIVNLA